VEYARARQRKMDNPSHGLRQRGRGREWLARLTAEPREAGAHWNEFDHYGYLCHQETVYTASYAAVPRLVNFVSHLLAPDRLRLGIAVLLFIGDIAGCSSRDGVWLADYEPKRFGADPIPEDLRDDYSAALQAADTLLAECIATRPAEETLSGLFATMAAVRGYPLLWEYVHPANEYRECPKCGTLLPRNRSTEA
jgi:hypothetical protein